MVAVVGVVGEGVVVVVRLMAAVGELEECRMTE